VRIVDAHLHLGECRIVDAEVGEGELISALDANGVDLAPVMPFPRASDPAPCTTPSPSSAAGRGARGIVRLIRTGPAAGDAPIRVSTREAEIVAAECARVWLETSRCSVHRIAGCLRASAQSA
jgi:hypothetical protein